MNFKNKIKSHKIYIKTHKNKIKSFLIQKGFSEQESKWILNSAQNNIILRLFLNVVKIEKKEKKDFLNEISLLLAISKIITLKVYNQNEKIRNQLIKKLEINFDLFKNQINEDIEENILKNLNLEFLKDTNADFFGNADFYKILGNLFVKINQEKKEILYSYGYLLVMYTYVSYKYKQHDSKEVRQIFLLKLNINSLLNKASMHLSQEFFNNLIIKMNSWIKKTKVIKIVKRGVK